MKRMLPFLVAIAAMPVSASAASVRLELSGSDYRGGPAFEVAFGRTVVGSGVVDVLADGGAGAVFEFEVPDLLLAGNPSLLLRFTNDARGGPGEDRNLYLISAAVNGEALALGGIAVVSNGALRPDRLRQGRLEIWSSSEYAVAHAPPGGWQLGPPQLRPGLAAAVALRNP
jgi:hypothetical protein